MASINLTMGTAAGTFEKNVAFTFTISSATNQVVTITGRNDAGEDYAWFSSDPYPAEIPIGSTSVTATPVEDVTFPDYFTYIVSGIIVNSAAHIEVGSSMPGEVKKAS
jgi:hypothetical protein